MAKLTSLQIFNKVANNLREPEVASLASLSGTNLLILNSIDHILLTVGLSNLWRQLETTGTLNMITETGTYTASVPSNYHRCDKNSFRYANNRYIAYLDSQELDMLTADQNDSGMVEYIYETGSSFHVFKAPSSSYNGDVISYRYWKVPDLVDTSTPGGNLWFPQGYDQTVLVNLTTALMFSHRENPKATVYSNLGNAALSTMKLHFTSPSLHQVPVRAAF